MIPNQLEPAPFVDGPTIPYCWAEALRRLLFMETLNGPIKDERGDLVAEIEGLHLRISSPLADLIPKLPRVPGVTAWSDPLVLETYYQTEIIGAKPKPEGFEYVYADWIKPALPRVVDRLKEEPLTRRAVITVGDNWDVQRGDPPCLQKLQFLVRRGRLDLITYWRSRAYASAAATNIFGMVRLQQDTAEQLGLRVGVYQDISGSAQLKVGNARNPRDHGDKDWVKLHITNCRYQWGGGLG